MRTSCKYDFNTNEFDKLAENLSDLNISEEDAYKAACGLEKYMKVQEEVEMLLSRRTRKYGHYH